MKLKLTWLLTLFMAFVMQLSFGQEKDITGTVTAASDGLPLPGVNVIVKGTAKGTQTDFDGNYTLKSVKAGDVIVFSFVSMKTTERTVGAGNVINVSMADDVASLDEVVITGYSTTTKAKSSVSSVRVSSETIENRPNASFVQTLSGQVPGLNITTSTGQPGGNSLVQLRGVGSINGNTEPLFIIDGAPVDEDNFRSLNPQEIASIDVLKDAGATAIYGNRGANGVIIIKTRTGSFNQGLKVNYNGFVSYSTIQSNDYNLMNSQQLLTYERDKGRGAGAGATANKGFRPVRDYLTPGFPVIAANTVPMTDAEIAAAPDFDWFDYFFRTAVTQNHTISLSSGGENSTQFTSIGFSDTQGILVQSGLTRFNLRTNVTGKSSNDKFNYGLNLSVNYSKSDEPNNIGGGAVNRNYVLGSLLSFPYNTPDQIGIAKPGVIAAPSVVDTPFFLIDRLNEFTRFEEEVKIVGSINANYKFTDFLSANVVAAFDYQNEVLTSGQFPNAINSQIFGGNNEQITQDTDRVFTYNQVTSLNYNDTFGKHTFDVGLYTEYFKAHRRFFGFNSVGLNALTFAPQDGAGFIDDGPNDDLFVDGVFATKRDAGLFSYFASFDYDSKYGLAATVRRDASFRFADSNRYATFWSVSGRWNISNEAFMDDSVFNNLKLRASYGTAGNQDIVGLGPFSAFAETLDLFVTDTGYISNQSIFLDQVGNRNLRWETIAQLNVGIDFGVWQNRLRGSVDYYKRNTTDLFQGINLSATTGFTQQNANIGELENRGVDFQVDYDVVRANAPGDFAMTVGVVGNYNVNELIDLPVEELPGTGREGGPLGEYFLIRYAGVNPATGNLLYLDANNNLTENPTTNDQVWTGKNILPDWNGGVTFNFDYKGFFLTTQWNYVLGVDRFDSDYAGFVDVDNTGSFQLSADILREWTQPGDITDIPSPTAFNRNSFTAIDDNFLYSGDYLRLRFASFGYNFNQDILEGTGFTKARLFFNAENALTFTKWRGFDVETRDNGGAEYPTPATFSVGVELGF
ncbi:SusC/RagA family TonB-linked outer membrane protein [Winogradskyella litorisediminis]|uniref:SusC/RagA family TonB-linked outer membrane protein n=1 Tax=Winogradskyella litorisediminis TaxID=1156618 RepID=A0ABW3N307_9FLAO